MHVFVPQPWSEDTAIHVELIDPFTRLDGTGRSNLIDVTTANEEVHLATLWLIKKCCAAKNHGQTLTPVSGVPVSALFGSVGSNTASSPASVPSPRRSHTPRRVRPLFCTQSGEAFDCAELFVPPRDLNRRG